MEIISLNDAVSNIVDNRGKTCPTSDFGMPLIATNCVKSSTLYPTKEKIRFVDQETYKNWFRGHPFPGDILFVNKGSPGEVCLVPDPVDFCIAQDMVALRADEKKIYSLYLFAVLRSPMVRYQIDQMHVGTMIPHFKKTDFDKLHLPVPSKVCQKFIGDFYYQLSLKIELNQKMNQTLEEIAKAIFKSWFVDFDPVRAKAEGRTTGLPPEISDLFPDELVESEIGEMPNRWELGVLSDLADITMGQSPPGDTYNDEGEGLPFYQGSTDFGFRFPSIRKYCSDPRRLAIKDDVLLSVRAPVGDLNRAYDKCCIGRGLASIRSKNDYSSWIYYCCSYLKQQFDTFNSEGTVFGSINGKDLKSLKMCIPSNSILELFEKTANPIDKSIRVKSEEISIFTELRDVLLPKLISGELRVPDAEKFLEEAGV